MTITWGWYRRAVLSVLASAGGLYAAWAGIRWLDLPTIHGLVLLRGALIVATAFGGVLCAYGMRVAWLDLQVSAVHNGGRKIAARMRLKVETIFLLVFVVLFLLAVLYLAPAADLARSVSPTLPWRAMRSRLAFAVVVGLLLAMKLVMHLGRKESDDYYDQMELDQRDHGVLRLAAAAQREATDQQVIATDAQRKATTAQADATSALKPEPRE